MRRVLLFTMISLCSCVGGDNLGKSTRVSSLSGKYTKVKEGYHKVTRGDTLTSIAERYRITLSSISRVNNISLRDPIYPGQKLLVPLDRDVKGTVASRAESSSSKNKLHKDNSVKVTTLGLNEQKTDEIRPQTNASTNKVVTSKVNKNRSSVLKSNMSWLWPASGKVIRSFSSEITKGKGVHIQGSYKDPVMAAESGTVVYSGNALKGYGNLIIIKHQNNFLSAYAHNHVNVVKEGETVSKGQRIAEMGRYYDQSVLLHFELRKDGKPVDPERFINH